MITFIIVLYSISIYIYSVTVYETQSNEIVGRYSNCKEIPTNIETFYLTLKKTNLAVISPSELELIKNNGGTLNNSNDIDIDNIPNPVIVIGDAQGGITLLRLHQLFGISADAGVVRKRNTILFKEAMDQAIYLPVHYDWVTKIIYIEEVGQMVTASLDGCICFIEMNKFTVIRTFYGHCSPLVQTLSEQHGHHNNGSNSSTIVNSRVTTSHSHNKQHNNINNNKFIDAKDTKNTKNTKDSPETKELNNVKDYLSKSRSIYNSDNDSVYSMDSSKLGKYVASGGGRKLLIWDPFTLKVVYTIDDYASPITSIIISDGVELMFIATTDKNIHVYHNITYELLQVVVDTTHYSPQNIISDMLFVGGDYRRLYTVGNKITSWQLER